MKSVVTWLTAFLLLAGMRVLPAVAAEPFAEASISTKGQIVAGQQITIDVDVFVPNFFTSAPQFPLFDLANAIVTLPDGRAQNLVRTANGEQFSGIRRSYLVIPQLAGEYTLPPAGVPFSYASVPGQSTTAIVNLPPTRFTVGDMPGQSGASPVFAATDVELTQSLDRDPASIKVGETLVRTVTLFAQGTQAMMLPQPRFDVPPGIKLYEQTPSLEDGVTDPDNKPGSKRIDRVTYVMEQEGKFTLPALALDWFDTGSAQAKQAILEPLALTVKASPAPETAIAPEISEPQSKRHLSMRMLILGAFICLLVWRSRKPVRVGHALTAEPALPPLNP